MSELPRKTLIGPAAFEPQNSGQHFLCISFSTRSQESCQKTVSSHFASLVLRKKYHQSLVWPGKVFAYLALEPWKDLVLFITHPINYVHGMLGSHKYEFLKNEIELSSRSLRWQLRRQLRQGSWTEAEITTIMWIRQIRLICGSRCPSLILSVPHPVFWKAFFNSPHSSPLMEFA